MGNRPGREKSWYRRTLDFDSYDVDQACYDEMVLPGGGPREPEASREAVLMAKGAVEHGLDEDFDEDCDEGTEPEEPW